MKTIAVLAVSAAAIVLTPLVGRAADAAGEAPLPPTYIIHKLTQDGIALRALEAERGGYEARVEATDGSLVQVGIDPQTAELTDAYGHARARKADGPAPRVDAAAAIQAVAVTGHWDVGEVEYEHGAWRIDAGDDAGRTRRFTVDADTGAIR